MQDRQYTGYTIIGLGNMQWSMWIPAAHVYQRCVCSTGVCDLCVYSTCMYLNLWPYYEMPIRWHNHAVIYSYRMHNCSHSLKLKVPFRLYEMQLIYGLFLTPVTTSCPIFVWLVMCKNLAHSPWDSGSSPKTLELRCGYREVSSLPSSGPVSSGVCLSDRDQTLV